MDNLDKKNELDKELQELAPSLAKIITKQRVEDLPFRYFENLPDRVFDKLKTASEVNPDFWERLLFIFNSRKALVWAIASIVGVIAIAGLFLFKSPVILSDMAQLDRDEVKTYLISQAADLEDDQLLLLHPNENRLEMMNITDEDLKPVLEEYLYQINNDELN